MSPSAKPFILLVEDEVRIAELITKYFVLEGFAWAHLQVGHGVVEAFRRHAPDLLLLDLMLPEVDGLSLCKAVRRLSDVPIIMLTARVEEIDKLIGFDAGADDYVCKPFSPKELMARIKVQLKRSASSGAVADARMTWAGITMDSAQHSVFVNEQAIKLTNNEFNLLKALLSQPDRVFSRQSLLLAAQGHSYDGYERNIDSHIKNVRRKLAAVAPGRVYIASVYGVGYKFVSQDGCP